MSLSVTINSVDITKSIDRRTLIIDDIITRQVNRCSFTLRKYGSTHTVTPIVGQEVIILDNGTRIFAGVIVKYDVVSDDNSELLYNVTCNDFTRTLDRFLINDSFQNQTVNEIIDFILTDKGLYDLGFTMNNVIGDVEIESSVFRYEQFSDVLAQLADKIGYDWYIDYNKDIHFFPKNETAVSFDIEDTTGSYLTGSLVVRRDNSQVKNIVIVRGGEYLGNTFTAEVEANGTDFIYPLGYKYKDLTVTLTGESLSVGLDYINDENDFDVLWNFQEKILRWKELDKPSDGADIRVGGRPFLPVIVKVRDQNSIDTISAAEGSNGEYEYVIIDKTINTRAGARERARAELDSYKATLVEAEFATYNSGLIAGQNIRLNSTLYGIDDTYVINKVVYRMRTEDTFQYKVSLISTRTFGIIDYLRETLLREKKQIVVNDDEVLDVIEAADENMNVADIVTASISHNLQSEAIDMTETFTAQSLDFETEFVVGPFTPSGKKRVFLLNGSILG